MINRKPTRVELNMEDIEEYEQLKKEQTEEALKKQQQQQKQHNNSKQFPLSNKMEPPKKTTAQTIGFNE